jgi:hypothetical protein
MKIELPTAVIILLLAAWVGQVRLYRGMQGGSFAQGDPFELERAIAKYGGTACLFTAITLFFIQFIC